MDKLTQEYGWNSCLGIPAGMARMDQFTSEFNHLEERRVGLNMAEKLLDLPTTFTKGLFDIQMELQGLGLIYQLYKEFEVRILLS